MSRWSRRLFLGVLGVGGVSAVGYAGGLVACRFVPRNHPGFFALLDVVPDDAATRHVGLAFLAERPGWGLDRVAEQLVGKPLIAQALGLSCPKSLRELVQAQCRADFAGGRHLTVEGLVLSETEAMLCSAGALARAVT